MFRGIYTSTNGMGFIQNRIDTVTNNMANVNTTGFKRDIGVELNKPNFENTLAYVSGMGTQVGTGNFQGRGVTFSAEDDIYTIVNDAGEIGIDYFGKTYLTKSGVFTPDKEGFLATKHGNRLMGTKGPIQTNGGKVDIDKAGNIKINGQVVDTLYRTNPRNSIGIVDSEVVAYNMFTKHDQGAMTPSGDNTDMALEGLGFFTISTKDGFVYSRNGNFKRNLEGYLVTQDGNRVQGMNGDIKTESENFKLLENGDIYENGVIVDKLRVTDFSDYRYLEKVTGNTFVLKTGYGNEAKEIPATAKTLQGVLEGSNVNSATEIVDLVVMNRNYEASQKVVQAYDQIMQKAANEIGRLA